MNENARPDLTPHARLDFESGGSGGTTCALLTPAIKARLREIDSGQVLEVRVDDPAAREDILSWSRMAGHQVLAIFSDEPQRLSFYLRKK